MTAVVLGLGNDYRRDDGLGPAVAREVAARVAADIRVSTSDGDPTRMLDAWAGADLAVLVDAVVSEPPRPGTVHRFDPTAVAELPTPNTSTHGVGLATALELGRVLDRLPRRWVLYAVEVVDLGYGRGLSPVAAGAVEPVVRAVLSELASTTGQQSVGRSPNAPAPDWSNPAACS
ncbi:hydrogenase maturation protease [Rhodococcus koreensis]|uniref:Hydrogenase maturation protease n=1 Tax=Rhodococcus koreensis TaxID=99653 RepID=A0A1H4IAV5_9NOCA|nr:hydrogenase maturation protease [Rhodococcus koreensis]SEB31045.1 hydrogenase maturation protease [Rhodococcus koreensis]